MGLFRRIAGFLGFVRDDAHDVRDGEDDDNGDDLTTSYGRNPVHMQSTGLPRKGFSVPVQVSVDRPQSGPILVPCDSGHGGVQVCWYFSLLSISFFFFFFFFSFSFFVYWVLALSLLGTENKRNNLLFLFYFNGQLNLEENPSVDFQCIACESVIWVLLFMAFDKCFQVCCTCAALQFRIF